MGISRKRPATKNNYTDFSDSRNILPLQSSLYASRLGHEVARPQAIVESDDPLLNEFQLLHKR